MPDSIKKGVKRYWRYLPMKHRMGRNYWKIKKFLDKAQWWDHKAIEEWQLQKVKQIVKYAYENVPGYHHLYKDASINPDDIQTLKDVNFLPFVTKEMLRDNSEDFRSRAIPRSHQIYNTTGDSTGIPFGFYNTWEQDDVETAFLATIWGLVGYQPGDKTAALRGSFIGMKKTHFVKKYTNCMIPFYSQATSLMLILILLIKNRSSDSNRSSFMFIHQLSRFYLI